MTATSHNVPMRHRLLKVAILIATIVAIMYPIVNLAARLVLEDQLKTVLQCDVHVGSVQLRPTCVTVRNIRLLDASDDGEPLLKVREVRTRLTISDGLQNGIWIDDPVIVQPTLRLKFSAAGILLTDLPIPRIDDGRDGAIPIRAIKVIDGSVVIEHAGKKPLNVVNVTAAIHLGDSIRVAAIVPELFGGHWRIQAALNAESWSGGVRISAAGLTTTSEALAELPFVDAQPESLEDFAAHGSFDVLCRIPAAPMSPLDCSAQAVCRLDSLDLPGRHVHASQVQSRIRYAAGKLVLSANANVLQGIVRCEATIHVDDQPVASSRQYRGHCRWTVHSVPLAPVARTWHMPNEFVSTLNATLNASGTASAVLEQNQFRMKAETDSVLSEIEVLGVHSAPLIVKASIDGEWVISDGIPYPAHGTIAVSASSDGVAVNDVIAWAVPRMQSMSAAHRQQLNPRSQRLQQWNADGRFSFALNGTVPLAAASRAGFVSNAGVIEGTGGITCHNVTAAGLAVNDISAIIQVDHGRLGLRLNNARVFDAVSQQSATVACCCSAPLTGVGRATADIDITNVSLATVPLPGGLTPGSIAGQASAWIKAEVPIEECGSPAAWAATGAMLSPRIIVCGEPLSNCQLDWTMHNNRINISRLHADWQTATLTAQAAAELTLPHRFVGTFALGAAQLTDVSRAVNRVVGTTINATGTTSITGSIVGDAASMNWTSSGEIHTQNVVVAQARLGNHRLNWSLTPSALNIEESAGMFFGGSLSLTASPGPAAQPVTQVVARIIDVQVAAVREALDLPLSVTGAIDCEFVIREPMMLHQINGQLNLRTRALEVAGIDVESFAGSVVIKSGQVVALADVRAVGANCNASIEARVSDLLAITPEMLSAPKTLPVRGQMTLKQLPIDRVRRTLATLAGRQPIPAELNGRMDINLRRTTQAIDAGTLVLGDVTIRNLTWNRILWSSELVARLQMTPKTLTVREVTGTFADGRVAGRGMVSLAGPPDGNFRFTVSRVNLAGFAAPLRLRSGQVTGAADIRIEGRLGKRMSGRASVVTDRAKVCGVACARSHLPLDWSLVPSTGNLHVNTRSAVLDIGGGHVHGQMQARWNGRLDLDLAGQAHNVDTRKVLGHGGVTGGGMLHGSVQVRARSAASLNDLSGQFQASLKDAQALKLPVLNQTSRFLGSLSRSTSFEDATIKGRFANGVATLERMTLTASNVRMVIDGSATLAGNLNLQVAAYTSETGPADKLLQFANSPIMLAAPAPVAVIAKVNDALKDRTIHVQVGGTIGRPLVRLQPGRQLQQETLRFLVQSSLNYSPDTFATAAR